MRARPSMARRMGDEGFALMWLIVALGLLAVVVLTVTPLAVLELTVSKEEETRRRLTALVAAIAGIAEQGTFGFVGDVGRLPKSLAELNDTAGPHTLCDAAFDPAAPVAFHSVDGATAHRGKVGMGWRGPYAKQLIFADDHLKDAWGQPLQYTCPESTRTEAGVSLTVRTGQIVSAGPDSVLGTADDVKSDPFYDRGHLFLTITQGGGDQPANNVTATLYFVSNGEQTSQQSAQQSIAAPEGSTISVVFASIPAGVRFTQIDFGGNKNELYHLALQSNIANRFAVKVPVGQGGKP